jgi:hypothetical protein
MDNSRREASTKSMIKESEYLKDQVMDFMLLHGRNVSQRSAPVNWCIARLAWAAERNSPLAEEIPELQTPQVRDSCQER